MKEPFRFVDAIVFLKPYIQKQWKNFLLFYLGWLFVTILGLIIPICFGRMIDAILSGKDMEVFLRTSVFTTGLYLFCWMGFMGIYRQHNQLITKYAGRIKEDIFQKYKRLPFQEFIQWNHGELLCHMFWYPEECVHFIVRGMIHQINRGIRILFIIFVVFRINLWFGVFFSGLLIISTLFLEKSKEVTERTSREVQNENDTFVNWLWGMLRGFQDILLLHAVKVAEEKLEKHCQELFLKKACFNEITMATKGMLKVLQVILQLMLYAGTAYLIYKKQITLGTMTVLFAYYDECGQLLHDFYVNWQNAYSRIPYIHKLKSFLELPEEQWMGKESLPDQPFHVYLKEICFSYGTNVVIHTLNLSNQNEIVGISGKSGCGKTTLLSILATLQKPQSGSVQLNGIDIQSFRLEELRKQIGIMTQEGFILDGTIRENLQIIGGKHTDEDFIRAMYQAGLGGYCQKQKNVLDVILGEYGVLMSGGEKQRLELARLYLKNPSIVLLDEPTASLDPETEKQVLESLREFCQGRTTFLVSHRAKTLEICDRIFFM